MTGGELAGLLHVSGSPAKERGEISAPGERGGKLEAPEPLFPLCILQDNQKLKK